MLPKTYNLATPRQRYYIKKTEVKYDVVCACLNKDAIRQWISKYKELDAAQEEPDVIFNRWNANYKGLMQEDNGCIANGSLTPILPE